MSDQPNCSICKQPFRDGEWLDSAGDHSIFSDCIAAVVRRCEQIVLGENNTEFWETEHERRLKIAAKIRSEFPEAFNK